MKGLDKAQEVLKNNMNFKQWFENSAGFTGQSMVDPATDQHDHPPPGTADPNMSLDGDDKPPTKKNRRNRKKEQLFANFGEMPDTRRKYST